MWLEQQLRTLSRPVRYKYDRWTFARSQNSSRLAQLRDQYVGKPLLVVGNGPSLNQTPLDDFAEIPAIGMNKIHMLFGRTAWRPSLILVDNPIVAHQAAHELIRLRLPLYFAWRTRYFVSRRVRRHVVFHLTAERPEFSTDIVKEVGSGPTVTYSALQYAYWLGADPVIIFGVDHNFQSNGLPLTYERRSGLDRDHFDPNYFSHGQFWGVPDLDGSTIAYRLAKQAFESDGKLVVDATVGGKLDVFPKVSVAEARRLALLR